jgi:pimeloyl-ACP methyl ester carboxylesterase
MISVFRIAGALIGILFIAACARTTPHLTPPAKVIINPGADTSETREVPIDGGRKLVVTTQFNKKGAPWLVYIPGSGDGLNSVEGFEPLEILTTHHTYNILIINKVGVGLDDKVASPDAFQRGSIRSQRIHDNLTVMKNLIPDNAVIQLVSLSEGAYIAPEIAQADLRVKSLILLSGNSWSWLEEEVMYLPTEQRAERRQFLETEVVPNPVFDKFYSDWSYAYFDSYNTNATYDTLKKLKLPILALNGEKDDVLWLQGAIDNLLKLIHVEGKSNLEFHIIPEAGHILSCPDQDKTCDPDKISQLLKRYLVSFADRTL